MKVHHNRYFYQSTSTFITLTFVRLGCELFMDLDQLFSEEGLVFDWTEVYFSFFVIVAHEERYPYIYITSADTCFVLKGLISAAIYT